MERINETHLSGVELKRIRQKKRILSLLHKNPGLTCSDIAQQLGVSLPTAFTLMNELMELGLTVLRGEGESNGGRKPAVYGLAEDSLFVVACEIGRYQARLVVFNSLNQQVTQIVRFDTDIDDAQLTDKIMMHSRKLIEKNGLDETRIFGIGVIMPGLIDEVQGLNYSVKDENFRHIKTLLEKKSGKFVYVNNDARMQAYGEYLFGAARGYSNAIVVNWSWGIGLGIIVNGKVYNGSSGFAGELSHMKLVEHGDLCICGKRGCLETVASAHVVVNEAAKGIIEGKVSQLTEKYKNSPQDMTPLDVVAAAKSGDEFSIRILHQVGLAMGRGLAATIQLLNPGIIVLGGPLATANQFVLNPIQQSLNRYCLENIVVNTRIVISGLFEQSGLLGVTAMMYEKLFAVSVRN